MTDILGCASFFQSLQFYSIINRNNIVIRVSENLSTGCDGVNKIFTFGRSEHEVQIEQIYWRPKEVHGVQQALER